MTDPALLGLGEIAEAIAERKISSRETVEALLARIGRWGEATNAFLSLDAEAALAAADAADRSPPSGPLHGVPLAHKDMFYQAGRVATCGSILRRDLVSGETATVLSRLGRAGAIRLGALHMVEFAYGVTGHNAHFGPAKNPWNAERITGGSSSGSGAAVAARLTYAALGSDTGGSVRLPSHFCGVTGLKTTYGLVSRAGAMPLSASLDTIGPLARSAADVRLVMELIAGADPRDPETGTAWRKETRPANELTIGVPKRFYIDDLTPDVAKAFETAIATFKSIGVRIRQIELPDQARVSGVALIVLAVEASSVHRATLASNPDAYGPQTRARLQNGFGYSAVQYVDALRWRGRALAAQLEAMEGCDAIITPVARFAAPKIVDTDVTTRADPVIAEVSRFMRPANYLGLPSLALPAGFSAENLPIGVQLMGRPFGDDTLLTLGDAFQRETDHHARTPPGPL